MNLLLMNIECHPDLVWIRDSPANNQSVLTRSIEFQSLDVGKSQGFELLEMRKGCAVERKGEVLPVSESPASFEFNGNTKLFDRTEMIT